MTAIMVNLGMVYYPFTNITIPLLRSEPRKKILGFHYNPL